LIYLNAALQTRVHLIFDNANRGGRHLYSTRRAWDGMERSSMEYLSAIGPLLILLLFGGGIVIVAYLAFDDMRRRRVSWDASSIAQLGNSLFKRVNALPTTTLLMTGALACAVIVIILVKDNGYLQSSPAAPEAVAAESAQPTETASSSGATRTLTSSTCAANGCPTSCGADEILASAYCISGGVARLSDQLSVKDGVVTARCSSSTNSITVACARK
jgi:hypothetical protein